MGFQGANSFGFGVSRTYRVSIFVNKKFNWSWTAIKNFLNFKELSHRQYSPKKKRSYPDQMIEALKFGIYEIWDLHLQRSVPILRLIVWRFPLLEWSPYLMIIDKSDFLIWTVKELWGYREAVDRYDYHSTMNRLKQAKGFISIFSFNF